MNLFFKNYFKIAIVIMLLASFSSSCKAAFLSIESPEKVTSSGLPITVRIILDTEQDTLSGISGNFSFPSSLFDVKDISYEGSVVSLWSVSPSISQEKYIDGRTHIPFEGIFPGGYKGVSSPYYDGIKPGLVFSVTLIPKEKGIGTFVIDESTFNAFDIDAHSIYSPIAVKTIEIPEIIKKNSNGQIPFSLEKEITSTAIDAFITQDVLVNNGSWYLVVHEDEGKSSIARIAVAETDTYSSADVRDVLWRSVTIPYVLLHQNRDKYIHIKVTYNNGTYSLSTIPPVENSQHISYISRILIGIAIVLLFHFYGQKFIISSFKFFSKKS
jgi:hypothetical protein